MKAVSEQSYINNAESITWFPSLFPLHPFLRVLNYLPIECPSTLLRFSCNSGEWLQFWGHAEMKFPGGKFDHLKNQVFHVLPFSLLQKNNASRERRNKASRDRKSKQVAALNKTWQLGETKEIQSQNPQIILQQVPSVFLSNISAI